MLFILGDTGSGKKDLLKKLSATPKIYKEEHTGITFNPVQEERGGYNWITKYKYEENGNTGEIWKFCGNSRFYEFTRVLLSRNMHSVKVIITNNNNKHNINKWKDIVKYPDFIYNGDISEEDIKLLKKPIITNYTLEHKFDDNVELNHYKEVDKEKDMILRVTNFSSCVYLPERKVCLSKKFFLNLVHRICLLWKDYEQRGKYSYYSEVTIKDFFNNFMKTDNDHQKGEITEILEKMGYIHKLNRQNPKHEFMFINILRSSSDNADVDYDIGLKIDINLEGKFLYEGFNQLTGLFIRFGVDFDNCWFRWGNDQLKGTVICKIYKRDNGVFGRLVYDGCRVLDYSSSFKFLIYYLNSKSDVKFSPCCCVCYKKSCDHETYYKYYVKRKDPNFIDMEKAAFPYDLD